MKEINSSNSSIEIIPHENFLDTENEIYLIKEILIVLSILVCALMANNFLKKLHIKFINESSITILTGVLGGWILKLLDKDIYINSITTGYVKIFLIVLLPPIIYESSYNIKLKEFYKNFGTICWYAVIGTVISIIFIGYFMWKLGEMGYYEPFTLKQSFAYGAIISATDPVCILSAFKEYTTDPNFFLIVFGESIMNDAVSMVFYEAVVESTKPDSNTSLGHSTFNFFFILIVSTLVGMIIGFISAMILKFFTNNNQEINKIEVGMVLSIPWISYLVSTITGISAIVVIFFVGVSHAMYLKPYISSNSKNIIHHLYEQMAGYFEIIVFIFIGIAFFSDIPYRKISMSLIVILIILCLIGRFLNIIVCSLLSNISRSQNSNIDFKKQFFLWFAGVRGAMAFALSVKSKYDFPDVGGVFTGLTLLITVFTLSYASLLLEPVLNVCNIIVLDENSSYSIKMEGNGFFNNFKEKISQWNQSVLLPYVERPKDFENVKSRLLDDFKH